jgi:hypothetical protein
VQLFPAIKSGADTNYNYYIYVNNTKAAFKFKNIFVIKITQKNITSPPAKILNYI